MTATLWPSSKTVRNWSYCCCDASKCRERPFNPVKAAPPKTAVPMIIVVNVHASLVPRPIMISSWGRSRTSVSRGGVGEFFKWPILLGLQRVCRICTLLSQAVKFGTPALHSCKGVDDGAGGEPCDTDLQSCCCARRE